MTSTSNTMLVTFWRANTSRATSRWKPLNPHCVSCTGPTTHSDASAWNDLPRTRRHAGCEARMSDPSGWIRLPYAASAVSSASTSSGISSGGVAMSASVNSDDVAGRRDHPGPDRRALAAVGDRQQLELARDRLGPGADEVGGAVGAAVVDDEDLDRLGEPLRAGPAVAPRAAAPEVAEQLVERRAEPVFLVVRGQDDGQGAGGHAGESRPRRCVPSPGLEAHGRREPIGTIACTHHPPILGAGMIRRHAFWFRALLIAADAILAVGVLVLLSYWRFGSDWAGWWREIVPLPGAFLGCTPGPGSPS